MFLYAAFGENTLTFQEIRFIQMLKLAEKYGWTLDYMRKMSIQDFNQIAQITAGEKKAKSLIELNPTAFGLGGD